MVESGTVWKGPHRFSLIKNTYSLNLDPSSSSACSWSSQIVFNWKFSSWSRWNSWIKEKTDPAVQDWHERLGWPTASPVFMFLPSSEHWSAWPPCWAEPQCLSLCPDHLVTSASTASQSLGPPPAAACRNTRWSIDLPDAHRSLFVAAGPEKRVLLTAAFPCFQSAAAGCQPCWQSPAWSV